MKIFASLWVMALSALAFNPTVTLEYKVDQSSPKADILFVIDNSGSMNPHQRALKSMSGIFLDELKNTDFQITGISSDIDDAYTNFVIDRRSTNPLWKLKELMVMFGTNGHFKERVFKSVINFLNSDSGDKFLRKNSAFEIIVLTDEEEQSSQSAQKMADLLLKNNGTANAIIPLSPSCEVQQRRNTKLEDVASLTGGALLDLCQNEDGLRKEYASLAKDMAERALQFQRPALPVASLKIQEEIDTDSIKVFYGNQVIKGGLLHTGWVFNERTNTLTFGKEVKLAPQAPETMFTIQYDLL